MLHVPSMSMAARPEANSEMLLSYVVPVTLSWNTPSAIILATSPNTF